MKHIILFGASDQAKVVIDIVEKEGRHKIIGLVDRHRDPGATLCRHPVVGHERDLPRLIREYSIAGGIIAVGDNWVRAQAARRIRTIVPDFPFVTAMHPSTQIARGVRIGGGTVIMAGGVVGSDSVLGEHVIINTLASVDHDNVLGNFASLAPHAATGGRVRIGQCTAVCMGARVAHGLCIGDHCVIGAGATVLRNVDDHVLAYGTPAQRIKTRKTGEPYL